MDCWKDAVPQNETKYTFFFLCLMLTSCIDKRPDAWLPDPVMGHNGDLNRSVSQNIPVGSSRGLLKSLGPGGTEMLNVRNIHYQASSFTLRMKPPEFLRLSKELWLFQRKLGERTPPPG